MRLRTSILLVAMFSISWLYAETYQGYFHSRLHVPIKIALKQSKCISVFWTNPVAVWGAREIMEYKYSISTGVFDGCFFDSPTLWVEFQLTPGFVTSNKPILLRIYPTSCLGSNPVACMGADNIPRNIGMLYYPRDREFLIATEAKLRQKHNNNIAVVISNLTQQDFFPNIELGVAVRAPSTDDLIWFYGKGDIAGRISLINELMTSENNPSVAPVPYLESQVYSEIVDAHIRLPSGQIVSCVIPAGFGAIPITELYKAQPELRAYLDEGFQYGLNDSCRLGSESTQQVNVSVVAEQASKPVVVSNVVFMVRPRSGAKSEKLQRFQPTKTLDFTMRPGFGFLIKEMKREGAEKPQLLMYNVHDQVEQVWVQFDGVGMPLQECEIKHGGAIPLAFTQLGMDIRILSHGRNKHSCSFEIREKLGFVDSDQSERFDNNTTIAGTLNVGGAKRVSIWAYDSETKKQTKYNADFSGILPPFEIVHVSSFIKADKYGHINEKSEPIVYKYNMYHNISKIEIEHEVDGIFECTMKGHEFSVFSLPYVSPLLSLHIEYLEKKTCDVWWKVRRKE